MDSKLHIYGHKFIYGQQLHMWTAIYKYMDRNPNIWTANKYGQQLNIWTGIQIYGQGIVLVWILLCKTPSFVRLIYN